jgi:hypothetical protein
MSGEPSLTTHRLHNLQGPAGSIYKGVFCPEIWRVKTQNAAVNLRLLRQLEWLRRAALPLYLFLLPFEKRLCGSSGAPAARHHITHTCCVCMKTQQLLLLSRNTHDDETTRLGTALACSREAKVSAPHQHQHKKMLQAPPPELCMYSLHRLFCYLWLPVINLVCRKRVLFALSSA